MEAYKPYGRNPYGRNMGQFGNNNRPNNVTCKDSCKDDNVHMRHMSLAMGYVPMQSWGELYDPETAICQGTAFPNLNLIFCGARGKM